MRVLVVDDAKAVFMMVSEMLKSDDHQSFWAKDGREACEFLDKDRAVDLILLDWNMPIMDGLEFLKKNSIEKFTEAAIVMMTTNNNPAQIQVALESGAAEYIMKPFTREILKNKMELVFDE